MPTKRGFHFTMVTEAVTVWPVTCQRNFLALLLVSFMLLHQRLSAEQSKSGDERPIAGPPKSMYMNPSSQSQKNSEHEGFVDLQVVTTSNSTVPDLLSRAARDLTTSQEVEQGRVKRSPDKPAVSDRPPKSMYINPSSQSQEISEHEGFVDLQEVTTSNSTVSGLLSRTARDLTTSQEVEQGRVRTSPDKPAVSGLLSRTARDLTTSQEVEQGRVKRSPDKPAVQLEPGEFLCDIAGSLNNKMVECYKDGSIFPRKCPGVTRNYYNSRFQRRCLIPGKAECMKGLLKCPDDCADTADTHVCVCQDGRRMDKDSVSCYDALKIDLNATLVPADTDASDSGPSVTQRGHVYNKDQQQVPRNVTYQSVHSLSASVIQYISNCIGFND
ncbi:hypothetical protein ElyMa_000217400 [Elysia marginata]|uniref:Uncharacterized protein n=1 Tax=Elysia marginata TaxID=1093978 RepID=A0AAV4F0P4_9GAST|nr:hypothetical protein ElyMa_000217400 [Elysia marginata]